MERFVCVKKISKHHLNRAHPLLPASLVVVVVVVVLFIVCRARTVDGRQNAQQQELIIAMAQGKSSIDAHDLTRSLL